MPTTRREARTKRLRSLAGCTTCRARHMKCDERQPVCSVCQFYKIPCGGYKNRISFVENHEGKANSAPDRFRRPLFTESRRQQMSDQLASNVRYGRVDSLLNQLDAEIDHIEDTSTALKDVRKGPFGAFSSILLPRYHENEADEGQNDFVASSPTSSDVVGHELDLHEDSPHIGIPDGTTTNFPSDMWSTQRSPPDPAQEQSQFDLDDLIQTFLEPSSPTAPDPWYSNDDVSFAEDEDIFCEFGSILPAPNLFAQLPGDASFLLSHYGNTIIGHLSPLKHPKSPWHLMQLPDSKMTFAAIMLGDDPGSAALCVFHGILAISAYTLQSSSISQIHDHWKAKGDSFKALALQNLHGALRDIPSIPKKAKYKQILTAILTVITMLVYSGNEQQARWYAGHGEMLIRCKGLTKSVKSRKVRLLHHWYAYMRIFHESVMLCQNPDFDNSQSFIASSRGTLSSEFRLTQPQTVPNQRQLQQSKGREKSENDLLLEEAGLWELTMYPEIFGVPETWLLLLSLTIRLGNEGDYAKLNHGHSSLSWQEYSTYAQSLEKSISDWKPPRVGDTSIRSQYFHRNILPTHRHILETMWKILHTALRIYFYRRVYNLSADILQHQVETIQTCLKNCAADANDRLKYSAAFLWPAFIAAAEAIDENTQNFFVDWFSSATQKSSFHPLWSAYSIVKDVWHRRKSGEVDNITWCDVVREQRTCLFFC